MQCNIRLIMICGSLLTTCVAIRILEAASKNWLKQRVKLSFKGRYCLNTCIIVSYYLIHNVWSQSQDIVWEYFRHLGFFAALAQPDVVNERSVATAGVHEIEVALLVDEHGMLHVVNFTNILRADFFPKNYIPNCKPIKAAKTLLYKKTALKLLVKLHL